MMSIEILKQVALPYICLLFSVIVSHEFLRWLILKYQLRNLGSFLPYFVIMAHIAGFLAYVSKVVGLTGSEIEIVGSISIFTLVIYQIAFFYPKVETVLQTKQ